MQLLLLLDKVLEMQFLVQFLEQVRIVLMVLEVQEERLNKQEQTRQVMEQVALGHVEQALAV